jgi:hypothetical protein
MLKFRFQATTRKPDGQLKRPYAHEAQLEAPNISLAIQRAREYQVLPSDGTTISWLTQINQPDHPDMVVWAMTARDGVRTDD